MAQEYNFQDRKNEENLLNLSDKQKKAGTQKNIEQQDEASIINHQSQKQNLMQKLKSISKSIHDKNEQSLGTFLDALQTVILQQSDNEPDQKVEDVQQKSKQNSNLPKIQNNRQKLNKLSETKDKILQNMNNKTSEGLNDLKNNVCLNKPNNLNIIQSIMFKNSQGLQQLVKNIQKIDIQTQNQLDKKLDSNLEYKINLQEDQEHDVSNQFISEEFNSNKKIQEIRSQTGLNHDPNLLSKQFQRQHKLYKAIHLINDKYQGHYKSALCAIKSTKKEAADKIKELSNSKIPRQNSSNSQRIKSASRKGSQGGSEQFNFDLTMKSKNSKNPFSMIKQDSLMYSAQSDFGHKLQIQSPQKNDRKSCGSKDGNHNHLEQIQDNFDEQHGSILNMNRSQSQKLSSEPQIQEQHKNNDSSIIKDKQQQKMSIINTREGIQMFTPFKNQNQQSEFNDEIQKSAKQSIAENLSHFDYKQDDDHQNMLASADFHQNTQNKPSIRKRVETQAYNNKKQQNFMKKHKKLIYQSSPRKSRQKLGTQSNSNIFSTEISNYQNKIAKIREAKELKKKKLQQQLAKVNSQIKLLKEKQEDFSPNRNNYASRMQISKNTDAQRKAQRLVKNLRSQKRNRNIAKIGQFKSLDRNINDYMEQLNKLRADNQEKIKQKKKLEILQRMKQNQMRKISQRKKKQETQHFVSHLKGIKKTQNKPDCPSQVVSKRSPTRNLQTQIQQNHQQMILTPELSNKKAYLNKIRSFSIKKSTKDLYEQALS